MTDPRVEKFNEIKALFKRLSDEMCFVVESYYIWRALTFATSVTEVGQELADRNLKIINRYTDFFTATRYSHFKTFVLGINIFFDAKNGTLSLAKLMREIVKYRHAFKPEVAKKVLGELDRLGLVPDDYTPIDQETIDAVNALSDAHANVLVSLEKIRHERVAHVSLTASDHNIIPVEVEQFIEAIQDTFNKLSAKFDLSSTHWGHLKDGATGSTKYLLEDLEKGDIKRREEMGY